MTTESLIQIFTGILTMGLVGMMLSSPRDDDDGPGGGLMQPVYAPSPGA
jgi:hypothetical protein